MPVLKHDAGHSNLGRMGQRQGGGDDTQMFGNLRGAAMKAKARLSAWLPHHLDLQPVHAVADPGAERLGCGFLGGKPRGKALGRIALAQAVRLLRGEVNPIEKTLP